LPAGGCCTAATAADLVRSNAIATRDPAGNRKLDKSKATGRIDGMVALAMAIGAATRDATVNEDLDGFLANPVRA